MGVRKTARNVLGACLAMMLAFTLLPALEAAAVVDALGPNGEREELDARAGTTAPSAAQLALAKEQNLRVTWSRFGTPQSIFKFNGWLAKGLSSNAVEAAHSYLAANRTLLGVPAAVLANLELVNDVQMVDSKGHSVTFRQTFGDLHATQDGLVTVGVVEGKVAYASSSLTPATAAPAAPSISEAQAVGTAIADAGYISSPSLGAAGQRNDWTLYQVQGISEPSYVRRAVLPMYDGSVRPAFEVLALGGEAEGGYKTFVDGVSGDVLYRENLVDHASDNPRWKYFKLYPGLGYGDYDTRIPGCWVKEPDFTLPCKKQLKNPASPLAWDIQPGPDTSSFTTKGNNANTSLSTLNPLGPSDNYRPISPDREYIYPFTNYWHDSKCNLTNPDPNSNDMNSAIVNLFVQHNRMHDWAYYLGFKEKTYNLQDSNFGKPGAEGDAQNGNAQAAAVSGAIPQVGGRNNANQRTTPDGVPPITNMYLWQPSAGGAYPPCVDGDFDMTVVAHEYTHATSNRMVAGPDGSLSGVHGRSMGESWSDLAAVEYAAEYGYSPVGKENKWAVGAYVTGNKQTGIRNYGMNRSPLNFSDMDYDIVMGDQVHANGEIWSATNFDLRQAFVKKYNKNFPAKNRKLQKACANGKRKPYQCPGNRRWAQIFHDAFLLMPGATTMVDARDAYLAADKMRFNSRNHRIMWKVFAKRGLGATAHAISGTDLDPKPSFKSPKHRAGTFVFKAVNRRGKPIPATFYVGKYEARVTPIANTDPDKKTQNGNLAYGIFKKAKFVKGRYSFNVVAPGYGQTRFRARAVPGKRKRIIVRLYKNLASKTNGAIASGAGSDHGNLIDDTEATNWAALGMEPNVKGAKVTVDLAGKKRKMVRFVQVSAIPRPRRDIEGQADPADPPQGRFQTLRRFAIQICTARVANAQCAGDKGYRTIYRSPKNAFPAVRMRPQSPVLIMRRFNIPNRRATHIRLVVLENQCTGGPQFQGKRNQGLADCDSASDEDKNVRAAELQVFSRTRRVIKKG